MKRFMSLVVLSFLACVLTPLAHAARAVPMPVFRNEVIVSASREDAAKETHDAIIAGAARNKWVVVSDDGNTLRLNIEVRAKHSVAIDVHIRGNAVDIDYVSSANMLYETDGVGGNFIHRNYGNWVRSLLNVSRAAANPMSPAVSAEPSDSSN